MYVEKIKKFFSKITALDIALFAVSATLEYIFCNPIFIDGDVAWHISSGEYIRSIGKIPFYDPWSYVGQYQQWYNISWLWDIFLSYVYALFNFKGISILSSASFGVFIAIFHRMLCKNFGISYTSKTGIGTTGVRYDSVSIFLAISFIVLIKSFGVRPQLISYFFMLAVYHLLTEYQRYYMQFAHTKQQIKIYTKELFSDYNYKKLVAYMCFTTIIWANLHGGFIFIGVILGVLGLEAIYKRLWLLLERWFILGILCAISTLINPIGYKIYVGICRTFFSIAYSYILEWHSFTFGLNTSHTMTATIIIIAGFAYLRRYNQLKVEIYEWLLGVLLLFMALNSIRGFTIFVVLGARASIALIDATIPEAKYPMRIYHIPWIIAIIGLIAMISTMIFVKPKIGKEFAPIEEINFVTKHYPKMRFINPYVYGGSIIFFGKGKIKHFIDGRAGTVFTEDILTSYVNYLVGDGQNWADAFKNYDFDGIMLRKKDLINSYTKDFFSRWQLVFEGPILSIFMKRAIIKFDESGEARVKLIQQVQ